MVSCEASLDAILKRAHLSRKARKVYRLVSATYAPCFAVTGDSRVPDWTGHDAKPSESSRAGAHGCPHKYPGRVKTKRTRHRRWRLSSLHCFHRLKADRFQLCVAQLAAVDLHESNATSSLAKINKIVANL